MDRSLTIETTKKVGEKVKLQGWVDSIRDHGKITFIDLRDRSGKIQCVGNDLPKVSVESVIQIEGKVAKRPEKLVNPNLETGKVEIQIESFNVINLANEQLPIPLEGSGINIEESLRLEYRYLDLRRPRMQKILRLRSKFTREIREFLYKNEFVEIETPMLTKSTKEGARDFIVPSRHNPGKFYALPQSPQQYKQLLMASGFERYFQIARCIRDEDLRADRGYEHTQIDIEMSFVGRSDVMSLVEEMVKKAVTKVGGKIRDDNFPVIDYGKALEKYGADKFDMRNKKEKSEKLLAFAWVVNFPFFKKVDKKDAAEVEDSKSGWTFTHNPFSNPVIKDIKNHLKRKNVETIKTDQYDLVCNGYEVGGGSIRAHDPEVLKSTFRVMGYTEREIDRSIGHMLKAFRLGTPPHGGIALGLDRLIMILSGESSVKETIAFPMTSTGRTAVMDAPSDASAEQLKELGIKLGRNKKPD